MNRLFEDEEWNYRYAVFPIMILFTVFLIWASYFELDEVVRGQGKVVPSGKTKEIQHLEGGIISEILVQEGDVIAKGDVIYELSQAFFKADYKTKDIELKALQAKAIRLLNTSEFKKELSYPKELEKSIPDIIQNELQIFEVDARTNTQKIQIAEDQYTQKILKLEDMKEKKRNLSLELKLAVENMKILDTMYKKQVVSKQQYLKELQKKQELVTKVSDIESSMPIVEKEISEALEKVKTVKSEIKSNLLKDFADVQVKINSLEQRKEADEDRNDRQAIISPVDGTVQKLYFYTVGGIIKAGDKVAEITPRNEALIIEARIKTSDRALVYSGQNVKIAITAYDTSKYGLLEGKVLFVSADSQSDEATKGNFYLVRIRANKEGFSPDLPILPGMVANVNILTGKKTIMEYMLKPLKDVSFNALGEK